MADSFSIGINAYEANVPKRVGSNLYAFELLHELEIQTRPQESQGVLPTSQTPISWTIYLPSPPLLDLPQPRPGWEYRVIPPKSLWTQWRLPLELHLTKTKHDVFVSLGHFAPRFCPFPSVVCILDLAFLQFPQFFLKKDLYKLRAWTKYSVKNAKYIFTISERTKLDVEKAYGVLPEQIGIVHPGISSKQNPTQDEDPFGSEKDKVLSKYALTKEKYIVSIGTVQPRKNILSAIKAFEKINPTFQDAYSLVLIGKYGWLADEVQQAVDRSPQKERIICTGFVTDAVKNILLKNSSFSFLVGYYEGFGIPAVESLSYGILPVVANAGSLPEVVGEYGVLVDPYSIDSIASGFTKAIQNPPTQLRRRQMMEWAAQFSWKTSSAKMIEILLDKFKGKQ